MTGIIKDHHILPNIWHCHEVPTSFLYFGFTFCPNFCILPQLKGQGYVGIDKHSSLTSGYNTGKNPDWL